MVGNTLKCSINALFFLVLPYCSTSLSYDYYISRVSSPPSHQLFFHGVTAGESRVRRGTIGPLGVPPGNWTAGSSCLKEDWRWYLGGGPLSGQVMVHNVIAYLSSLSVKQCQASISNTVAPENYSIITVLVMKKIAQNGSNWLHFSETNHACSENTEIHSENEGNNGVEPVSGPNKCKMVLGRNTETWKMRNPCDVAGKLGSDQMGGG